MFKALTIAITLVLAACGDYGTKYEYRDPGPQKPLAPVDKEAAAKAAASVVKNCTSCHSTIQAPPLRNEAEIAPQKGRICVRVKDGSMPPAGSSISAQDRAIILEGFGC